MRKMIMNKDNVNGSQQSAEDNQIIEAKDDHSYCTSYPSR